jgi:pectinesterase inhibitor-like protein
MRKRPASKAPIGLKAAFGHVGDQQAGHRTFGFRTGPAESGTSVQAPPPAEKELRLRICRAGPGFGPGAAKTGGPRTSVHGRQAEPEASAEDPAIIGETKDMAKSAPILFLLLSAAVLYLSGTARSARTAPSNFIKTSCSTTTYPTLCVESLSVYSSTIQQSQSQLAQTALSVSQDRAESARTFVAKLRKMKGLKKREYEAIDDCIDEMGDTVDRLSKSVKELKSFSGAKNNNDFVWHMSNVETWVSAALTDENTCVDGFAGKGLDGKIKSSVKAQVVNVAQVTSNALSLINQFASSH